MESVLRYTFGPCSVGDHVGCAGSFHNASTHTLCECDCHQQQLAFLPTAEPELTTAERLAARVRLFTEIEPDDQLYLVSAIEAARALPEEPRCALLNQLLHRVTRRQDGTAATP